MFVSKILSKIFFHTNNTTLNEMADFMFTRKTCARIQSGEPTDEGTNGSLRHPPLQEVSETPSLLEESVPFNNPPIINTIVLNNELKQFEVVENKITPDDSSNDESLLIIKNNNQQSSKENGVKRVEPQSGSERFLDSLSRIPVGNLTTNDYHYHHELFLHVQVQ